MEGRTMYERLMSLPLFKGVSAADVSLLLEKYHSNFFSWNRAR